MILIRKLNSFLNALANKSLREIFYLFLINFGFKKTSAICLYLKYKLQKYPVNNIYFMHINKCGGTSLRTAFSKINITSEIKIISFPHAVKSKYLNFENKNKYMMSIRHPLSRVVSAFYDRKRSKNLKDPEEIKCFQTFPEINDLGEALSSKNLNTKNKAIYSLKKMAIVKHKLEEWISIEFLKKNKLFFLFELENINSDFYKFCNKVKLNKKIFLKLINKNTALKKQKLSKLAKKNFIKYYKNDLKIYNYLLNNKKNINNF